MDVEERARLAVALLPPAGPVRRLLGAHPKALRALAILTIIGGTLLLLAAGVAMPHVSLLLLGVLVPLIGIRLAGYSARRESLRAIDCYGRGDLDTASRIYFELLERRFLLWSWRSAVGLSLASAALFAGHAERAVVLLRAVERHAGLPPSHRSLLLACQTLALLALGRLDEARLLARSLSSQGRTSGLATERRRAVAMELLVAVVGGTVDEAVGLATELVSLPHDPTVVDSGHEGFKRAFGWVVVAYAWDRAARARTGEALAEAERHREAACLHGRGVPRFYYAYLSKGAPELVAFADQAARAHDS